MLGWSGSDPELPNDRSWRWQGSMLTSSASPTHELPSLFSKGLAERGARDRSNSDRSRHEFDQRSRAPAVESAGVGGTDGEGKEEEQEGPGEEGGEEEKRLA